MKNTLTFIFLFTGLICLAQADTSLAGDVGSAANGILALLTDFGVKVPGWVGLAVSAAVFLIRHFGIRRLKRQHAEELRQALASAPTMNDEHRNLFQRIVDKLEGNKK